MERVALELPGGVFHALLGQGTRPLVFLHGFPDHPPTARGFLDELTCRGHRVLAPWLRGYAPSPRSGPYDVLSMARELISLIDRWSPDEPVDLVGHDWGAVLTYLIAHLAPARIRAAVTLAVPHPRTFVRALRRPAQLRRSWYMGLFQLPGAGWITRRDDFALIDRLWRAWSPGFTLPADASRELHATLGASMPAPLEYYRAALRHGPRVLSLDLPPITTPLLALHGADDGCIVPPEPDDPRWFAGEHEQRTLPGVGHFLHVERPLAVAALVSEWLSRSYPRT